MFSILGVSGIDHAIDGKIALKKLINHYQNTPQCKNCKAYELVILDQNMPKITGYRVAVEIKNLIKDGTIPIDTRVVLSSADDLKKRLIGSENH